MIIKNFYPKDKGATDYADSSRLAGMMTIAGMPEVPDCSYYVREDGLAIRCPIDPFMPNSSNPNNFTRDQLIPLAAGLFIQSHLYGMDRCYIALKKLVETHRDRGWRGQNTHSLYENELKPWWKGADLIPPSVRYALMRAAGMSTNVLDRFLGILWFKLDILFASIMGDEYEINQLVATAVMLNRLRDVRKVRRWREKLREYWCGWRGEQELADNLIKKIESA